MSTYAVETPPTAVLRLVVVRDDLLLVVAGAAVARGLGKGASEMAMSIFRVTKEYNGEKWGSLPDGEQTAAQEGGQTHIWYVLMRVEIEIAG